jgi:electron transfer flavoprotein beta subunit
VGAPGSIVKDRARLRLPGETFRGARVIQVVCVKQVPDTETRVKLAADGRHLDPAGVTWVLNPYDEYAVEQALRVREQQSGGEVVAISVGGAGAQTTLRNVLALGADRAIHLRTDQPAPDPLAVARALAAEIRGLGPGLVWFGKQAVDDDQAQVGPIVAELLDLPCATVAASFALEGEKVTVERDIEGGREVLELTLPAVISADKGLNEPRYASLKGIMAAKKKPIEEKPAELGEPNLEVVALELPPARAAGRIVGQGAAAAAELVRVLREEAKVI